jgi:phage shock protein PspC (stress-responsive transcriptional regulator)
MKKTLTANINGTVFHIEEDAYDKLQRYLSTIRAQFAGTEGCDEIMADIEARIAELFHERLDGRRQVVALPDVEHVIGVMGQPEDYIGDEETGAGGTGTQQNAMHGGGRRHKRLMRDTDDRWVGGVLSGIAAYFGIDPLILRLIYIGLLLLGVGWLIYLILWIVVPPAETAADKLEMRGEPVNVENIRRVFEEGGERLRSGAERVAQEVDHRWHRADFRSRHRQFRAGASRSMSTVVGVVGKLVGGALLIAGIMLGILLIGSIAGGGTLLYDELVGGEGLGRFELGGLIFNEPSQAVWFFVCSMLLALIPVVGLVLAGIRLLFGVRSSGWLGATLGILWAAALVVVIVLGARLGSDFKRSEPLRTEHAIAQPAGDVLHLDILEQEGLAKNWNVTFDDGHQEWDGDGFAASADSLHGAWAHLDVVRSPDDLFHLVVERKAQARNTKASLVKAAHITYNVQQEDSVLRFSPWLHFPKDDKFRVQRVRFVVQVPVGKAVYFTHAIGHMLDDVKNVTNTYDRDMTGRTWTMTSQGLSSEVHPSDVPNAPVAPAADSTTVRTVSVQTIGARVVDGSEHAHHDPVLFLRHPSSSTTTRVGIMPDLLDLLFLRHI